MLTEQQKWNRYRKAINFCISYGYFITINESNGNNIKSIKVSRDDHKKQVIIPLKPRKYKPIELLYLINLTRFVEIFSKLLKLNNSKIVVKVLVGTK